MGNVRTCNRRIPVATIAYNYTAHQWNIPETAHNFGISDNEVLAALLFYEENKALIDEQEQNYQAQLDEMYQLYSIA